MSTLPQRIGDPLNSSVGQRWVKGQGEHLSTYAVSDGALCRLRAGDRRLARDRNRIVDHRLDSGLLQSCAHRLPFRAHYREQMVDVAAVELRWYGDPANAVERRAIEPRQRAPPVRP